MKVLDGSVVFSSVKELRQALEEVEQPTIETVGVDGPGIAVISHEEGEPPQIMAADGWTRVETDYDRWAEDLAQWARDHGA